MAFGKIFEVDGVGQVLVKLGADDNGNPELRWYAEMPGLGVCEIAVEFKDTEQGWNEAETAFEKADQAAAKAASGSLLKLTKEFVETEEGG